MKANRSGAWLFFRVRVTITAISCSLLFSCSTVNMPPAHDEFCEEMEAWIAAGPRDQTNKRTIIFPDGYDCFGADSGQDVFITCLVISFDCPEGIECADAADQDFKSQLMRYAHTSLEIDYFNRFNLCLGSTKRQFNNRDQSRSLSKVLLEGVINTHFNGDEKKTIIEVNYRK